MSLSIRASVDDYISRPWLIPVDAASLLFAPLIPQLFLAYLLFSPSDTTRLRRLLVGPIVALSLVWSFSFQFDDPTRITQSIGLRSYASWFYLRTLEIGLRRQAPTWVGYEMDGAVARAHLRNGKANGNGAGDGPASKETSDIVWNRRSPPRPTSRWQQFVYGITYFFAFRLNLGWSNSVANPDIVPDYQDRSRLALLWHHLVRAVVGYVLWDLTLAPMGATPVLSTFARRWEGSVWDPMTFGTVALSPLVSAVGFSVVHVVSLSLSMWYGHHVVCLFYSLLHPGRPAGAPPLFIRPWAVTSISDLWSRKWHQAVRGLYLFLGGEPARRLARRLGGGRRVQQWSLIIGVFAVSAIQHSYLYTYMPTYELREHSRAYLRFFALQPVGMAAERLFLALTGRRVSGPLGALWMWSFELWAGLPVCDTGTRLAGTMGHGGGREGEELMPFGAVGRKAMRWGLGWD